MGGKANMFLHVVYCIECDRYRRLKHGRTFSLYQYHLSLNNAFYNAKRLNKPTLWALFSPKYGDYNVLLVFENVNFSRVIFYLTICGNSPRLAGMPPTILAPAKSSASSAALMRVASLMPIVLW